MGADVAEVTVVDAGVTGEVVSVFEGGERGGREVGEAIGGLEAGEVDGDIGPELLDDPGGHAAEVVFGVIEGGDEEGDDLEVDTEVAESGEGVEDGLEPAGTDIAVEVVGEGLEVNLDGGEMLTEVDEGFAGDEAVGDGDGAEGIGASETRGVEDVFGKDGGLGIGEGEGWDGVLATGVDEVLRGEGT